ncbi:MAG: hypothetical protein U1F57_11540 [bacterium]
MKKYQEQNCGRVDTQNLLQTQELFENSQASGPLLSCGGVYLPRNEEPTPANPHYQFLTLGNRSRSIMVLNHLKVENITHEEMDLFEGREKEEVLDPNSTSSDSLKKFFKEQLN